ncbi:MAG: hypothetical protein AB8G18_13790 [Gammaproteobacteria bacterium]
MRRLAIAVVLFAGLTGCGEASKHSEPSIVGSWELQDSGEGDYFFTHVGFTTDGVKCVMVYEETQTGVAVLAYLNTYKVVNGVIVTTYGKSNEGVPEGEVMRDRIDLLNAEKMHSVMIQPPDPQIEKHIRLPDVDPQRICGLVKRWLGIESPPP